MIFAGSAPVRGVRRCPGAVVGFSGLLATAATGNYRLGGVMVAAAAATEVLFAGPVGRRLDRIDPVAAIVRLLLAAALTLALLATAGALNLWSAILVALAVTSSTLTAGVPAGLRRILTVTVPPTLLTPALALDGVLGEFAAVGGPLIVAAAALLTQVGGVITMAVLTGAAALLARGLSVPPAAPATAAGRRRGPGVLRSPGVPVWMGIGLAGAQAIGLAELCALPISKSLGGGSLMAVGFQAVLCVFSAVAGIGYGACSERLPGSAGQRATVLLVGLGAGTGILAAQPGLIPTVVGYAFVGACTAPLVTTVLITVQRLVPQTQTTEAFGIYTAFTGVGYALAGAALAALSLYAALLTAVLTLPLLALVAVTSRPRGD
jgi:hypothetical protein